MAAPQRLTDLGSILHAADAVSPVEGVEAVARELGIAFGAVAVSFLLTDLSGRALIRLAHAPLSQGNVPVPVPAVPGERRDLEELATSLPFDGGVEEEAIRTQTVQVLPPNGSDPRVSSSSRWRVLAPVSERGESIGLLEMYLPDEPYPEVIAEIAEVAHLLAYVVIANRRHTDLFEWGQRSQAFSLSAEIQQRLLPAAQTCQADAFTLAAWLEPAATIAGDTFDYTLARDVLHLSLTDAMGHGIDSALTASICLGGLRGSRRGGTSLVEQAEATNATLAEYATDRGGLDFATGLVGRVDLPAGVLELVNAGHVAPYLLRDSVVTAVELPVDLPLGMFADTAYRSTRLVLERGDRVVFVTDGMLERNAASVDVPAVIRDTRRLHPREVVRALADSALVAAGHRLQDDATVLCLDWHGSHGGSGTSASGDDLRRASAPLDSTAALKVPTRPPEPSRGRRQAPLPAEP